MNKYFDKDKLIISKDDLILKVNCKHCLPCGICERKSSFDETIMCNQFQAIELKLQRKTCMNCLNKGIAMKDFPCKECNDGSKWEACHE